MDTGHNFPEVIDFREQRVAEMGERLIVAHMDESIKKGTVRLAHPLESRNGHQTVTLLEAIEDNRFDCLIGGARRDEEKARAKERIFSHRDSFGQWQPKEQRPELWNLFNTRIKSRASTSAAFPISNWTELDVWLYIAREGIPLPNIYFKHARQVIRRKGLLVPLTEVTPALDGETVGDRGRALPHCGRHDLHLPGESPMPPTAGRHRRRDPARDRERAWRHPHGRPHVRGLDGAPQEGRLFLMNAELNTKIPTCRTAKLAKNWHTRPCVS